MADLEDSIKKGKEAIDEATKSLNELGTIAQETFASIGAQIQNNTKKLKSNTSEAQDTVNAFKLQERTVKGLNSASEKLAGLTKKNLTSRKEINQIQASQVKIESSIVRLNSQIAVNVDKINRAREEGNKDLAKSLIDQNIRLQDAVNTAEELKEGFIDVDGALRQINKSSKSFDAIGDALNTIPGIGPLISGPFKSAGEAARNARVNGDGFFKSLAAGAAELVTIKGILTLVATTFFAADKSTTSLATNLQISKEEAKEIKEDFKDISTSSGKAFLNTANLVQSTIELSKSLGAANELSLDLVKSQTFLNKQLGLSVEESSEIQKLNALTGKNAQETEKQIADQVANLQKETGIALRLDDIFSDVANTNEELKAAFGFNTKEIAKSVVEARRLGLTIEQSARAAESLLDFEQSIQNELSAELLTGKNLNLEQARLLALQGKSTDAAAELVKQVGSVEEFTKMNVIQQRALASVVGMESNELIKTVRQREVLNQLGAKDLAQAAQTEEGRKKLLELGGEQLLQQAQQESAAAKFESAIVKIQETIGILVEGPLGSLIDGFASVASSAGVIYSTITALVGLSLGRFLAQLATAAALQGTGAVAALTTASAVTLGLGLLAIGAAVTAGIATMNSQAKSSANELSSVTGNDVISKPSGLSGYGDRMLLGPEGAISLNNKDTIVAGTDLFKADDVAISPEGTNMVINNQNTTMDNTALITKVDQLIAVNERILAKSSVIEMNGNQVGQEINTSERAIQ